MTKFMRSRHIPLDIEEPRAVQEEINDFVIEVRDAASTLKSLRENNDWTVDELSKKTGVDEMRIEQMENGEIPIPVPVAKTFGKIFNKDYRTFL